MSARPLSALPVSRRTLLAGAAAGALLSGRSASAQARDKLTIAYTAVPDFAAAFVAQERGFFKEAGLDTTLHAVPIAPNMVPLLVSGGAQIGGLTPPVFLQAVRSGVDLVAVAGGATYFAADQAIGVIVRADSSIRDAKGLEGKRIGVPGVGGTLHILARRWLSRASVGASNVSFIELPIPQMADVLRGGSVDAIVVPQPFIDRITQTGAGRSLPGFAQDAPDGFSTVFFAATRAWARSNAPAVAALRKALTRAAAWTADHRAEALEDVGRYFKVPAQALQATPFPHLDATLKPAHLEFWIETLRQQDIVSTPISLDKILWP